MPRFLCFHSLDRRLAIFDRVVSFVAVGPRGIRQPGRAAEGFRHSGREDNAKLERQDAVAAVTTSSFRVTVPRHTWPPRNASLMAAMSKLSGQSPASAKSSSRQQIEPYCGNSLQHKVQFASSIYGETPLH